jgi:hypothetical protein
MPYFGNLAMLLILISCVGWLTDVCPVGIEPPQFWTAIANDTDRDNVIRRISVIRLINRHATAGMTLTAFCRLLDNPNWLNKTDFTNWNEAILGGWIPAEIDRKNSTTFCFRVFPDIPGDVYAVYFRVSGKMDVDTLWTLFHGERPAHFTDATVLEIATSAGRDNLHWQRLKQRFTSTGADTLTGH